MYTDTEVQEFIDICAKILNIPSVKFNSDAIVDPYCVGTFDHIDNTISLSKEWMYDDLDWRLVVAHEMIHALQRYERRYIILDDSALMFEGVIWTKMHLAYTPHECLPWEIEANFRGKDLMETAIWRMEAA